MYTVLEGKEICALIPHQGSMCLLDRVLRWDRDSILCVTETHRETGNPLRGKQGLAAVHGIEYAAQAMALHGSLLAPDKSGSAHGYLVAIRDVHFSVDWLHTIRMPIDIRAECLLADDAGMIYRFTLDADSQPLLRGRLVVMG